VLSQVRAFYLRLTGRTHLLFFAKIRGLDRNEARRKVDELDAEPRLNETLSRRRDRCSTGLLRNFDLARTLLAEHRPSLLNEPTRSLDDAAVELFWAALDRPPDDAILTATHRQDHVAYCNRAIYVDRS
jgi:ABC-2 type transport system ATP-binding protein